MSEKKVIIDLDEYLALTKRVNEGDDSATQYALDVLFEIVKRKPDLVKDIDISGLLINPKYYILYSPKAGSNENPLKVVKKS